MLTKGHARVEPAVATPELYSLRQAERSTATRCVAPTRLTRVKRFRGFVYCVILLFEASNNKSV